MLPKWCWALGLGRQEARAPVSLVTGDVHFGHWAKALSASFLYWVATIFISVCNKNNLGKKYMETMQILLLVPLWLTHFSSHRWFLPCDDYCVLGKRYSSISAFTHWDSTERKSCPFPRIYLFDRLFISAWMHGHYFILSYNLLISWFILLLKLSHVWQRRVPAGWLRWAPVFLLTSQKTWDFWNQAHLYFPSLHSGTSCFSTEPWFFLRERGA